MLEINVANRRVSEELAYRVGIIQVFSYFETVCSLLTQKIRESLPKDRRKTHISERDYLALMGCKYEIADDGDVSYEKPSDPLPEGICSLA